MARFSGHRQFSITLPTQSQGKQLAKYKDYPEQTDLIPFLQDKGEYLIFSPQKYEIFHVC